MSDPPRDRTSEQRMKRAEYRAWTEQQPTSRFERVNGVVVAMAPERISHARIKARIWQALDRAIRAAGLPCEALPDGITVEVGDSDYEPDAIVRCGDDLPGDMIGVPDPMIVVEVLSPSTSGTDRDWKLQEYFRPPSVRHYLIVWAGKQQVAHHWHVGAGIETRIVTTGAIGLDPPGLTIDLSEIYPMPA